MAVIFMTGFEQGSNLIFDMTPVSAFGVTTLQARGAWSNYSMRGSLSPGIISWTAQKNEFYAGMGWITTAGGSSTTGAMCTFYSINGVPNITLKFNSGNYCEVRRGNSAGTVLATATTPFAVSRYYYVEVYLVISDTVGKYQVKVDGADLISLTTGVDTRNDAGTNGDLCDRWSFTEADTMYVDDCYVVDTTAGNTGFLGDVRIKGYYPNAAGDVTGLTRGGADSGANWSQVEEYPPNDATDYVYGTNTTSYDLYNIPNTSGLTSVKAGRLWWRAQKNDATSVNVAPMLKADTNADGTADTEYQGADFPLSSSWAYNSKIYDQHPDGTSWTPAKVDALQIGIKSR